MHTVIADLVNAIRPHDQLEQEHIDATLAWIDSGALLFRVHKPAIPAQHLVSYFVVVDEARSKLLLVDHRKAGLWLPSGGHVEVGEHPAATVQREAVEELGIAARFRFQEPLFITVTETVGATAGHTDVSLWYVLHGDAMVPLQFDAAEFHAVRWFGFADVPWKCADPHMQRFIAKLRQRLICMATVS